MDYLWLAFKTLGAIFLMTLIIPLMVWGGSGSLRAAVRALREYWLIMGALVAIGGAAAAWVLLMERIG
jgi:hypothetical protein